MISLSDSIKDIQEVNQKQHCDLGRIGTLHNITFRFEESVCIFVICMANEQTGHLIDSDYHRPLKTATLESQARYWSLRNYYVRSFLDRLRVVSVRKFANDKLIEYI